MRQDLRFGEPLSSALVGLSRVGSAQLRQSHRAQLSIMSPLLWLGLLEFFSFIGIDQMLRGSGREPGDYGATHHVATLCSHAT